MRDVVVIYHREPDGSWWAEAEGLEGFTAIAGSRAEIRRLTAEGVAFHLDLNADEIVLDERFPAGSLVDISVDDVSWPIATSTENAVSAVQGSRRMIPA